MLTDGGLMAAHQIHNPLVDHGVYKPGDMGAQADGASASVAYNLFHALDTQRTGSIGFEQFAAWWEQASPAGADQEIMATAWDCFDAHDTNQNDTLDEVEFGRMLSDLAGTGWHSAVDPASGQTYWAHPLKKGSTWHPPKVEDFLGEHGIKVGHVGHGVEVGGQSFGGTFAGAARSGHSGALAPWPCGGVWYNLVMM